MMSSYLEDDNVFMFCTAMITKSILHSRDNKYVFKPVFKDAIRPFGNYAFIFHSAELLDRLRKVQENYTPKFGFMSGPIIYRDLTIFNADEYRKVYRLTDSVYNPFFVKSTKYQLQNEWRLIIDGAESHLPPNNGDAFSIDIGAFDWGDIFEIDTLLDTFEMLE